MIEFYNRFKAGTSVFGGPLFNGLLHDYLPASLYVGFESTESSFEKEFFFGLAITAVILLLLYLVFKLACKLEIERNYDGLTTRTIITFHVLLIVLFGINNVIVVNYVIYVVIGAILFGIVAWFIR
ncbi:hypothetical protein [Thomasclavelia spiroformis]|uniref:hypothetical protein n=1 Tax=Thomasclavelia spiroformis TaxID=29348 RepID=UPI0032084E93